MIFGILFELILIWKIRWQSRGFSFLWYFGLLFAQFTFCCFEVFGTFYFVFCNIFLEFAYDTLFWFLFSQIMSVSRCIDANLCLQTCIGGIVNVDLTFTGLDGYFWVMKRNWAVFLKFSFLGRHFIFNWCHWVYGILLKLRLCNQFLELTILKGLNMINHHSRRWLGDLMIVNIIGLITFLWCFVKVSILDLPLVRMPLNSIIRVFINWGILISRILLAVVRYSFLWLHFVFWWYFFVGNHWLRHFRAI